MAVPPLYEIIASLRPPSTDEFRDREAHFEKKSIDLVSDLKGCEIFLKPCGCQSFALAIDDIQLYEGFDGFLTLGKLLGKVTWGDVQDSTVEVDDAENCRNRGWRQVEQLDNIKIGVPGSPYQFRVGKLRFNKLRTKHHLLAAITEFEALDLLTGVRAQETLDVGEEVDCIRGWTWECVNWWCSQRCTELEPKPGGGWRYVCRCDGFGGCGWWPFNTCTSVNCAGHCEPIGFWNFCSCSKTA